MGDKMATTANAPRGLRRARAGVDITFKFCHRRKGELGLLLPQLVQNTQAAISYLVVLPFVASSAAELRLCKPSWLAKC